VGYINSENVIQLLKAKIFPGADGPHLYSQLLRKQRVGGSWFEANQGK
jgi:hypothetical protein